MPTIFWLDNGKGRDHLGDRYIWEDNIRMDTGELKLEVPNRMHLVQDRDQWWAPVNKVMNLQVP
jgi:hypothetical protein